MQSLISIGVCCLFSPRIKNNEEEETLSISKIQPSIEIDESISPLAVNNNFDEEESADNESEDFGYSPENDGIPEIFDFSNSSNDEFEIDI